VYQLTAWGRELEDLVLSLGRWAARSPAQDRDAPIGADSLALALKDRFDAGAAKGLRARYELRLADDRFRVEIADQAIRVARGGADRPDATIDAAPTTLAAVLWQGRRVADAQRAGALRIDGDAAAAKRLLGLFPLPEPVAAGHR
jgi:alkyl sulfatase BDS1-like metallo-beta-lactamase superfamily hydrolase